MIPVRTVYVLAVVAVQMHSAASAAQPTCPLGSDFIGRTRGDITVYEEKPVSGNCNMDLARLQAGSKGWTHFVALPKYSQGGYQGGKREI